MKRFTKLSTMISIMALAAFALANVDIDALVGEILEREQTDPALHEVFREAVAEPCEAFEGELDAPIQIGWTSPSFDVSDAWERYYVATWLRLEECGIPYEMNFQTASTHDAHDEQLAHIETFLAAGVDFIVLGPTELEAQRPAISAVHEEGIPLIIINHTRRLPDDDQTLMYTAFDHEVGGVMTGEWIMERFDGSAKIALLRIVPGDMDDLRWGGTWSVLEQGDFEVVDEEFTNADRQMSFDAGQNILTAHPDVDLIYGLCSACALGSVPAISAMGLEGQVQIIGFGGTPEETEAMQRGVFHGSVFRFIDDLGASVGEAIKRYLEGRADEIPRIHTGGYVMMDDTWSDEDFAEVNEYATRYTRTEMD